MVEGAWNRQYSSLDLGGTNDQVRLLRRQLSQLLIGQRGAFLEDA